MSTEKPETVEPAKGAYVPPTINLNLTTGEAKKSLLKRIVHGLLMGWTAKIIAALLLFGLPKWLPLLLAALLAVCGGDYQEILKDIRQQIHVWLTPEKPDDDDVKETIAERIRKAEEEAKARLEALKAAGEEKTREKAFEVGEVAVRQKMGEAFSALGHAARSAFTPIQPESQWREERLPMIPPPPPPPASEAPPEVIEHINDCLRRIDVKHERKVAADMQAVGWLDLERFGCSQVVYTGHDYVYYHRSCPKCAENSKHAREIFRTLRQWQAVHVYIPFRTPGHVYKTREALSDKPTAEARAEAKERISRALSQINRQHENSVAMEMSAMKHFDSSRFFATNEVYDGSKSVYYHKNRCLDCIENQGLASVAYELARKHHLPMGGSSR